MSDQSAAPPHIPYQILSQEHGEDLTPDGRFEETWTIRYTGPSGTSAFVKIPARIYSAAEVDRQIQAQLEEVEAVHRLGAQPHPDNLAT